MTFFSYNCKRDSKAIIEITLQLSNTTINLIYLWITSMFWIQDDTQRHIPNHRNHVKPKVMSITVFDNERVLHYEFVQAIQTVQNHL